MTPDEKRNASGLQIGFSRMKEDVLIAATTSILNTASAARNVVQSRPLESRQRDRDLRRVAID